MPPGTGVRVRVETRAAIPAFAWLGDAMKIIGTSIAATLLLIGLAQAQDNRVPDNRAPENHGPSAEGIHYGWADVLRVDPVYGVARIETPRQECYDQPVVRQESSGNSTAGTILGAVVGGVLGNTVGKGDGRTAATVVGAVGGAVVGNEIEKDNNAAGSFDIYVRMDDGRRLILNQRELGGIREGSYVDVEGNRAHLIR